MCMVGVLLSQTPYPALSYACWQLTRLTTSAVARSAARSAGGLREVRPHTRMPSASAALASRAPAANSGTLWFHARKVVLMTLPMVKRHTKHAQHKLLL